MIPPTPKAVTIPRPAPPPALPAEPPAREPADYAKQDLTGRDFLFLKHDVTNYIYVEGEVDLVLHWASPASPIDYLDLPIPTLKVGALGTHKALGLARAKASIRATESSRLGEPAKSRLLSRKP